MKTRSLLLANALVLAVFLLGIAASSRAQTPTVITSLPYIINHSGTYVLNDNLSSAQVGGTLIQVSASNVTVDFQGHFIAGPLDYQSQPSYGIDAYERSNVTIKNGTIAYCFRGIHVGATAPRRPTA